MLSGETAAGQYPFEAVNIMDRIVARVEQDPGGAPASRHRGPSRSTPAADAIAAAARQVGHTHRRAGDRCIHRVGATALRVARERPEAPIIGLTPNDGDRPPDGRGVGRARGGDAGRALDERGGGAGDPRWRRRRGSPSTAKRSWSPRACRSARPGRPTHCGWRPSGSLTCPRGLRGWAVQLRTAACRQMLARGRLARGCLARGRLAAGAWRWVPGGGRLAGRAARSAFAAGNSGMDLAPSAPISTA